MKTQHFVTFYSPGTLMSETTTEPIDHWDTEEAQDRARGIRERHGATPYGFLFTTRSRGPEDLDSKETSRSPMHYLGGEVQTLEEIKARQDPRDRILISNMEGNGYDRVLVNTNSWKVTMPLGPNDVVLDWHAESPLMNGDDD